MPLFPWRGKEAVAGKDWVNTDDTKDPDPFVSLAPATAFPRETVRSQLKLPLFDLLGNAMEFCRDPFLEYSKLTALKPMADSKDYSQAIADPGRPGVTPEGDLKDHVVRGSSWAEPRDYCTLQRRRRERELEGRLEEVGFRVCIPAK